MFKHEYQGGPVFEIFSAQGKDPVAKWKLSGGQSAIFKEFDKAIKSFVYILEGDSQTHKMQMPRDGKSALGLIQKFLVLQVNLPIGKDFSAELLITDAGNLKRRLYLSTVHKDLSGTPLHARIPLSGLTRNTWSNVCIDLASFTREMFKGAVFQSLDAISISACCKVRRIFTMKREPVDSSDRGLLIYGNDPLDEIPRSCQLPTDVQCITQNILLCCLTENAGLSSARAASSRTAKTQDSSHIAFGSRVAGPPPPTCKKSSSAPNAPETMQSLNMNSGRLKLTCPHTELTHGSYKWLRKRPRNQKVAGATEQSTVPTYCSPGACHGCPLLTKGDGLNAEDKFHSVHHVLCCCVSHVTITSLYFQTNIQSFTGY
uniref:CFA20 domain-containing protein n=1 Tax=Denticeps clupeoides TaxID=299321 RepID=A0AAY4CI41_9TELE